MIVTQTADAWGYFVAGFAMGGGTVLGVLAALVPVLLWRWGNGD